MNAYLMAVTTEDRQHALLRSWAADMRDRKPPYQRISPQAQDLARTLCIALDALRTVTKLQQRPGAARNLSQGARQTVHTLVADLRQKGCVPPVPPVGVTTPNTDPVTLDWDGNFCYMYQGGVVVGYDASVNQYYKRENGKWVPCKAKEV